MKKIGVFEINKIYLLDCLEGLKRLPDESVDLILTDPPYNISKRSQQVVDFLGGKKRVFGFKADWDEFDDDDFKNFLLKLIKEFKRVLKKSGSLIIFTSDTYLSHLRDYVINEGMVFRQTCVWVKSNPPPQMRKVKFNYATELFFTANKEKGHDSFRWENGLRSNVFFHPVVAGNERTSHPTQKPLWLFKELVKYYSREGDVVLDPFIGSGTTAVACKQLGRLFLGFEISEDYFAIANGRLSQSSLSGFF